MADKRSRCAQAFQENGNLLGLTSLAALSAALLNPLPLLAGLVAEATYLLFVPDSQWYAARLSRKNDAEVAARRLVLREQTFPGLDSDMQARFLRLEQVRAQIGTQAKDEHWFLEVLRKLDYLLEKFLLFAGKEAEFRGYLGSGCWGRRGSARPRCFAFWRAWPSRIAGRCLWTKNAAPSSAAWWAWSRRLILCLSTAPFGAT